MWFATCSCRVRPLPRHLRSPNWRARFRICASWRWTEPTSPPRSSAANRCGRRDRQHDDQSALRHRGHFKQFKCDDRRRQRLGHRHRCISSANARPVGHGSLTTSPTANNILRHQPPVVDPYLDRNFSIPLSCTNSVGNRPAVPANGTVPAGTYCGGSDPGQSGGGHSDCLHAERRVLHRRRRVADQCQRPVHRHRRHVRLDRQRLGQVGTPP